MSTIQPNTVQKPKEELGLIGLLKTSLQLYRLNLPFLVLVYICVQAAGLAISPFVPSVGNPDEVPTEQINELVVFPFLVALGFALLLLVVRTFAEGVVVRRASTKMEEGDARLLADLSYAATRLPVLLLAGISMWGLTSFGLLFFGSLYLLPSIFFSTIFAVVLPAIIIEKAGFLNSFARSRKLVSGRWSKTMLLVLIIALLRNLSPLLGDYLSSSTASSVPLLVPIVTNVMSILIEPLPPVVLTLLYYSLLAKPETTRELAGLASSAGMPQNSTD